MMKQRRKWRGVSAIFALLIVVGLFAPMSTQEASAAMPEGWTFGGTVSYKNVEASGGVDHLYLYDDNTKLDAFCLNRFLVMDDGGAFNQRTLYDPSVDAMMVQHFGANENGQTLNWASDNANAIKYIKKALCYGYVGKAADLGVEGDALYAVTQDAIWQIAHYGRGWENGTTTSVNDNNPTSFVHGDATATDKLLKEYVFNNNIPEPEGELIIGHGPSQGSDANAQHVVVTPGLTPQEDENPEYTVATTIKEDCKEIKAAAGQTVVDTVTITFKNNTAGTFTLDGKLVDKSSGEVVAETNGVSIELPDGNGTQTVDVTFTVDASNLAGKELVAYEYLKNADGTEVGKHEKLDDAAQTLTVKEEETPTKDETENGSSNETPDDSEGTVKDSPDDEVTTGNEDSTEETAVGDENESPKTVKSNTETTKTGTSKSAPTRDRAVRTGDTENMMLGGMLLLGAAAVMVASRKRNEN